VALTDVAIRTAKPREKPYKLADGGGLYLHVMTTGARYWRMDYRFHEKRLTLAFGVYPEVTLADARERRGRARKLLDDGVDPGAQQKRDKLVARVSAANTFKDIGEEWLSKQRKEGRAEATLNKTRWMLEKFAYPHIGARPIADIEPPEMLAVLQRVEQRSLFETATRLRSLSSRLFLYAISTGRAKHDPSGALRGALTTPQVTHRAAILTPRGVGALMRAIDGYEGQVETKLALQLLALTFVRPGELRAAEWDEFDLNASVWRIPAEKMKMRQPHIVPLASQAVKILQALHRQTGHGRYLFPSTVSAKRTMSENTINHALRRLGYSKEEMTGHGFRRTASTLLNELGFNRDWIERQLAHGDADEIRAIYNVAEYLPDRQRMMQVWADYLDKLAAQGRPERVVGAA